ncbi:hypothetical protein Nepgr_011702 [Nepenthes gracilis]|uniref:Uncharacterized protein n=1 Tax=Nepenthes gracilis TaxID=150966 RepID=A0AAD3SFL6_NEPGR|nr:hypothetical protein Nepgr_011702 [Nepenthes gracilis]
MAKHRPCRKKKREESNPMDLLPKCVQQPRSIAPKRRTDFSLFFSSHSSYCNPDLSSKSPGSKDTSSAITAVCLDGLTGKIKDMKSFPLVSCFQFENKGGGLSLQDAECQVIEAESFPQNEPLDHSYARNRQRAEVGRTLEVTPEKSTVTGCHNICRTPACHRNGHLSSSGQSSNHLDDNNISNDQDQSSGSGMDKRRSTSLSQTEDEFQETGRGKRKRRPKIHFDELTSPIRTVKKFRRFKIMRHLGLAAPVGSPFTLPN